MPSNPKENTVAKGLPVPAIQTLLPLYGEMRIALQYFLCGQPAYDSGCCQNMIRFFKCFSKFPIIFFPKNGGKYWMNFTLIGNTVHIREAKTLLLTVFYLLILFPANI